MGNCWCFESEPRKKIVLLMLGLDNSGKTTVVKALANESRDNLVPTIGFSLVNLKYRKSDVNIYDLGGGPQIRGIWHSYFADAHGIIFVVDASNYKRLIEARLVLYEILNNEKLAGKPMLLLANKQDASGALDELDIVEKLKVEDLVNQQRCPTLVKACSAIEHNNKKGDEAIYKGYVWLLNLILRDYWKLNARVERDLKEQHGKNLIVRQEILNRIQRGQENRRNCVEVLDGGGDTASTSVKQVEVERSKSNNWVFESPTAVAATAAIENGPTTSAIEYLPPNVPSNAANISNHSSRKKLFARKRINKTAPATLSVNNVTSQLFVSTGSKRKLHSAFNRVPLKLSATELESVDLTNNCVSNPDVFTVKGVNDLKRSVSKRSSNDIFTVSSDSTTFDRTSANETSDVMSVPVDVFFAKSELVNENLVDEKQNVS